MGLLPAGRGRAGPSRHRVVLLEEPRRVWRHALRPCATLSADDRRRGSIRVSVGSWATPFLLRHPPLERELHRAARLPADRRLRLERACRADEQFAMELPVQVISRMLGLPARDHDRFRAWTFDFILAGVDHKRAAAARAWSCPVRRERHHERPSIPGRRSPQRARFGGCRRRTVLQTTRSSGPSLRSSSPGTKPRSAPSGRLCTRSSRIAKSSNGSS